MTAPSLAILRASDVALLTLAGRSMLDHALDRLAEASVGTVLIEPGGQARQLQADLALRAGGPDAALLDSHSGGTTEAIARAIADRDLDGRSVFLLDGGVAWFDGPAAALTRLADGFDADRFDGLLLLARVTELDAAVEPEALALDPLGIVRRPREREIAPFAFAGVQLLSGRLFGSDQPVEIAQLWDGAMARGRLGGLVHDGVFFKLDTARDVEAAEQSFDDRMAAARP